ncbi:hypothetical protein [Helcococcus kunzii]|uniref:hypothetical protein n=1 Tax=Helcococcus kunzii TaxID=40091 RepID=UPI0024AE753E|nr:hypothetical protein [Helcococcus kunzii]
MKVINKKQVLLLHKNLIKKFGGSLGVRDENLLDSSLKAPFQMFDDNDLFPTLI